jgi:hypothetical protein
MASTVLVAERTPPLIQMRGIQAYFGVIVTSTVQWLLL